MRLYKMPLLIVCLSTATAVAACYYMTTSGSDGGSGATVAPWATFEHAWTVMRGGDTLIVADGTG